MLGLCHCVDKTQPWSRTPWTDLHGQSTVWDVGHCLKTIQQVGNHNSNTNWKVNRRRQQDPQIPGFGSEAYKYVLIRTTLTKPGCPRLILSQCQNQTNSWYQGLVVKHSGDLSLILWKLRQELCVNIQGIQNIISSTASITGRQALLQGFWATAHG